MIKNWSLPHPFYYAQGYALLQCRITVKYSLLFLVLTGK